MPLALTFRHLAPDASALLRKAALFLHTSRHVVRLWGHFRSQFHHSRQKGQKRCRVWWDIMLSSNIFVVGGPILGRVLGLRDSNYEAL